MRKTAILYISYDGMLEPLGQSQVIAYLERLSGDYSIHLISFEKPADREETDKVRAIGKRLARAGIAWHPLTYHKSPTLPATLFDIAQGLAAGLWLTLRHRVRLVHARSYIPALIGWMVKLLTGTKLLFDMRGLWADERVDGYIWPKGGRLYRLVKRLEKTLLLGSDHIVTLTRASRDVIAALPYHGPHGHAPITVIPTCADLDRFRPMAKDHEGPFVLGYLGSIGTRYLFEEVLACFADLRQRRPDARLLVINRKDHKLVHRTAAAAGVPADCIEVRAADHGEVPDQVRRMTAGTAFYRPAPSTVACAPTKLAEYLGCGVPCLGNTGVGDMEAILEGEECGVALRNFDAEERSRAVDRLIALAQDQSTAQRCREVALAHFSTSDGAARYRRIYQDMTA